MNSLLPVWRLWCLWWYRRALNEIDLMHDDVGFIVLRLNELERGL